MLDDNDISCYTGIRHLGNFLNTYLDINVDINRTCSHCIGYYNQMMRNFGHLNPESRLCESMI